MGKLPMAKIVRRQKPATGKSVSRVKSTLTSCHSFAKIPRYAPIRGKLYPGRKRRFKSRPNLFVNTLKNRIQRTKIRPGSDRLKPWAFFLKLAEGSATSVPFGNSYLRQLQQTRTRHSNKIPIFSKTRVTNYLISKQKSQLLKLNLNILTTHTHSHNILIC